MLRPLNSRELLQILEQYKACRLRGFLVLVCNHDNRRGGLEVINAFVNIH